MASPRIEEGSSFEYSVGCPAEIGAGRDFRQVRLSEEGWGGATGLVAVIAR